MSVSVVAAGTTSLQANTGTVSPGIPAGGQAGDLLVLVLVSGGYTDFYETPDPPGDISINADGWVKHYQDVGGCEHSPPWSEHEGPRYITIWTRDWADGLSAPGIDPGNTNLDVAWAIILLFRKTTANSWNLTNYTTGSDIDETSTTVSVTGGTLPLAAGDCLLVANVGNTRDALDGNNIFSSESLTASGITFGTLNQRQDSSTGAWDTALGMHVYDATVNSGSGSVAPTFSATSVTPTEYFTLFLRVTDAPAGPNQGTATGAFDLAGTATGQHPPIPSGTVVGTYTFTGDASGSMTPFDGSVSGTLDFAGTATGAEAAWKPKNLVATAISNAQIDLTWDALGYALSYQVERNGVVIASGVTETSYSDTGLSPNTEYTYRVRGVYE